MEIVHNLFTSLLNFFEVQLKVNLLDIIICVTFFFYAYEGYTLGLVLACIDLASFILSFTLALKLYGSVARVLATYFSIPIGFANAGSFFLLAFVSEILVGLLLHYLVRFVPSLQQSSWFSKIFKKVDHILGILPGILSAFIILSFILTVIISLPSSALIKQLVTGSQLGSRLVANTSFFDNRLNDIFGGAFNETLNFMTVEPQSDQLVDLHFKVSNAAVDAQAEQDMFAAVNTERVKYGLHPLAFDYALRNVARAHSQDMFTRGYFSHFTPEGLSPFDRMNKAGVTYSYAGENLALAPSTGLAMQGLMNSPGHRANILSPNFGKIGIGAVDGGIYGIMFSQEFTN